MLRQADTPRELRELTEALQSPRQVQQWWQPQRMRCTSITAQHRRDGLTWWLGALGTLRGVGVVSVLLLFGYRIKEWDEEHGE